MNAIQTIDSNAIDASYRQMFQLRASLSVRARKCSAPRRLSLPVRSSATGISIALPCGYSAANSASFAPQRYVVWVGAPVGAEHFPLAIALAAVTAAGTRPHVEWLERA